MNENPLSNCKCLRKRNIILRSKISVEWVSFVTVKNKVSFSCFVNVSPWLMRYIKLMRISMLEPGFMFLSLKLFALCKTSSFLNSSKRSMG
jgi:hypothetical protein